MLGALADHTQVSPSALLHCLASWTNATHGYTARTRSADADIAAVLQAVDYSMRVYDRLYELLLHPPDRKTWTYRRSAASLLSVLDSSLEKTLLALLNLQFDLYRGTGMSQFRSLAVGYNATKISGDGCVPVDVVGGEGGSALLVCMSGTEDQRESRMSAIVEETRVASWSRDEVWVRVAWVVGDRVSAPSSSYEMNYSVANWPSRSRKRTNRWIFWDLLYSLRGALHLTATVTSRVPPGYLVRSCEIRRSRDRSRARRKGSEHVHCEVEEQERDRGVVCSCRGSFSDLIFLHRPNVSVDEIPESHVWFYIVISTAYKPSMDVIPRQQSSTLCQESKVDLMNLGCLLLCFCMIYGWLSIRRSRRARYGKDAALGRGSIRLEVRRNGSSEETPEGKVE